MWHWRNNEIRVAVQSCLWVRVELKASKLIPLERLNGSQWSWIQIPLSRTFYSYFEESVSGEYHMYQLILLHWWDYLEKTLIKTNLGTEEQPKWNITLNKPLNLSRCSKLAVNASWTLGVITQSVSASDWNSVVVGSNPTKANFL